MLDPDGPAVPPPYDPSPTFYIEIKPETATTVTYDKVCRDGGHTRHSSTITNNETYSRLNLEADPVYDNCQHNGTAAVPTLQGQYSEYSRLNVGQQISSKHIGQCSFVTTDNMSTTNGIPLLHKGTYLLHVVSLARSSLYTCRH